MDSSTKHVVIRESEWCEHQPASWEPLYLLGAGRLCCSCPARARKSFVWCELVTVGRALRWLMEIYNIPVQCARVTRE